MLFIVWSVTSFVFEIPSGAWADTHDRRRLLSAAGGVRAAGFLLWVVAPSFAGFAAGFVLWGVASAMESGTFEALVHDALVAEGCADRYAALIGSCRAAEMTVTVAAIALAGPLFALGGFALVGGVSVAAALVHGAAAWRLPSPRPVETDDPDDDETAGRYLATLVAGLDQVRRSPIVRAAVVISALAVGFTTFDEYFPAVASEHGSSTAVVPWLLTVATVGQLVGTVTAGRSVRRSRRVIGLIFATGGVVVAVGVLLGGLGGFILIGGGYGAMNHAMLVTEARVQEVITVRARATVLSVHGFLVEVAAVATYVAMAVGSARFSTTTLLAGLAAPVVVIGVLTARRLPDHRPEPR